jgi:anti-sigma factor RsiW
MTPETARALLHAYIDGETDAVSSMELESHLEGSPALRQEIERLSALHHAIQNRATRFEAPSRLTKSLSGSLPQAQTHTLSPRVAPWWRTVAIGASATAAALLIWSLNSEPRRFLIDEIVSAHVRSLMADHLTDLASAERHLVKPWLSNRLDFAPPVHELGGEGFVLVGARLDYIGSKPVAAIVYRYRQHIINVFVWPAPLRDDASFKLSNHRGYNSANFQLAGMTYWVLSDLNQNELAQLAKLLQLRSAIK